MGQEPRDRETGPSGLRQRLLELESLGRRNQSIAPSVENVHWVLQKVGANLEQVRIEQGMFEEAFSRVSIPRIALLNIDADWYESVRLCLETFYDAVVTGGFDAYDSEDGWTARSK